MQSLTARGLGRSDRRYQRATAIRVFWCRTGGWGSGTRTDASRPVVVSGLTNAVAVSASYGHSCALLASGSAKCWGNNSNVQLGNGTTTNSSTPVVVSSLTNAVAIAAGYLH